MPEQPKLRINPKARPYGMQQIDELVDQLHDYVDDIGRPIRIEVGARLPEQHLLEALGVEVVVVPGAPTQCPCCSRGVK